MPDFQPNRNQDAWATLRGFKYQIDLTIKRWLELPHGVVLELERGEDIDHVAQAMAAAMDDATNARQRLLEQIKHREANLTLRSPEAITAIVNFIAARHLNHTLDLGYRYTTNARAGLERPPVTADRVPGILVWNSIAAGLLTDEERAAALNGLRVLLQGATRPARQKGTATEDDDSPTAKARDDADWKQFQAFANGSDANMLEVIERLEWATLEGEIGEVKERIEKLLLKHAVTREFDARDAYQHLFLRVLELMCAPGVKRLDHNLLEATADVVKRGAARDRAVLAVALASLEERVGQIGMDVAGMQITLAQVVAQVNEQSVAQRLDIAMVYTASTPDLTPPRPHPQQVPRTALVDAILDITQASAWIAVEGSLLAGKSELALLLAQRKDTKPVWVRAEPNAALACLQLDRVLEALAPGALGGAAHQRYVPVAQHLGARVIVIDDLPQDLDNEYASRLTHLARALHGVKGAILTTSAYPLSSGLQGQLGTLLHVVEIPSFDEDETAQLLKNHGMPPEHASRLALGIRNITAGHPWRLNAAAIELGTHDWQMTDAALEALVRDRYAHTLNDEVLARLLRDTDDATRELLYRLNLVVHTFRHEQVLLVAGVESAIPRPRERLHRVLGQWVEQRNANKYSLAAPLRRLGTDDLDPHTKTAVSLALAEDILRNGTMNETQFMEAYHYLLTAHDFDRAGRLLYFALNDAPEGSDLAFARYYTRTPLPEVMALELRLVIRGRQLQMHHTDQGIGEYLVRDIVQLSASVTQESAVHLFAAVAASAAQIASLDFTAAIELIMRTLSFEPIRLADGKPLILPVNVTLESVLWFVVVSIRGGQDVLDWLAAVETLSADQRARLFDGEHAELGLKLVCDQVWTSEVDRPEGERDWSRVLDTLEQVCLIGARLQIPLVVGLATAGKIVVVGEYQQDLDTAAAIAERVLPTLEGDSQARFIVLDCMARQFVYVKRYDEALPWLRRALDQASVDFPILRVDTLLYTSRAIGPQDAAAATRCAQEAVALARDSSGVPRPVFAKALGELAICLWAEDERRTAFDAIEEAVETLLESKSTTRLWQEAFLMVSHLAAHLAMGAAARQAILSGEYPVFRGIVHGPNSKAHELFSPEREDGIYSIVCALAGVVGADERAGAWTLRGLDALEGRATLISMMTFAPTAITQLLAADRFEEVLDTALQGAASFVALEQLTAKQGLDIPEATRPGFTPSHVLGSKPSSGWNVVEYRATLLGLVPTAFRLALLALEDRPRAAEHALLVVQACRQIAVTASDAALWAAAEEVFSAGFVAPNHYPTLVELSNRFHSLEWNSLQFIGYLASTLDPNIPLHDAVRAHELVAAWAMDIIGQGTPILLRTVIAPFFSAYWRQRFAAQRFRFSAPLRVERALDAALFLPAEQQPNAVVEAIRSGL